MEAESSEPIRHFWWHWQNLNDRRDGTQGSGLRHGRCWWHFTDPNGRHNSRTIELSWNLWTHFCGAQMDISDEDVTLMLAFPPFALWLSLSTNWAWISRILPRTQLRYYPQTIVVDERECGVRIHNGKLWLNIWSKCNETVHADPWWIRGVSFNLNPFEWKFMRHEVRRSDWSWQLVPSWELGGPEATDPEVLTFPYSYRLDNGTIQDRTATVIVERRAWRPLCLRWTSLFEKVRTCIDVKFDQEVGEETGSWKGGCTGCGYELRSGESVENCLRRMEAQRRF